MKKRILLFGLILSVFSGNAQVKDITVNWKTDSYDGKENENLQSEMTPQKTKDFSQGISIIKDAMRFEAQWKDNGMVDATSLEVANIKYGPISSKELGGFDSKLTTSEANFSIKSSIARDEIYTRISANPVVLVNGVIKKILSFSVRYTKKAKRETSSRLQISNSVLATGEWFKFAIEKSGVYRLDKRFLNNLGMNTDNLDPEA
jgi:hypothetical protein